MSNQSQLPNSDISFLIFLKFIFITSTEPKYYYTIIYKASLATTLSKFASLHSNYLPYRLPETLQSNCHSAGEK